MSDSQIALIFFVYGLAFFSMGLAITLEAGRGSDVRLRHALRPLAAFGYLHGIHEWIEMFEILRLLPGQIAMPLAWQSLRIFLLAFSFLSLGAFGASLLAPDDRSRRLILLVPLFLATVWGFGALLLRSRYPITRELWDAADVWTRYVLAIPSALLACVGLVFQQRAFRRAGMARFGRDSLWAAVAFAWYGVIGQTFTRTSPLPPSNVINQALFFELFGFPIQLLRASAAGVAAFFVIRFLRSFEVETQARIVSLQRERLEEARRKEDLRGQLLKRIVAAQEAERQRIARELHDETGQALTALGLGLRGVSTTLHHDLDKASRNLLQLEGLAAGALDELQHIISDLRPSHLDDLGLPATLRWYSGEIQRRGEFEVLFEVDGEPYNLPAPLETALFRVAQEALTNVIKHADASQANVRMRYKEDAVMLEVRDNGSGFDQSILALELNRPSWGLAGMEERVSEFGGTFRLISRPGEGTSILVVIPYSSLRGGGNDDSSIVGG